MVTPTRVKTCKRNHPSIAMENFKQLSEDEITARIERIGGQGWVTPTDYKRFSRQAVLILEELSKPTVGVFVPVGKTRKQLENISGARRVASRIDELRDEWDITTEKSSTGEAVYKLIGRRWEARKKKAHCTTCYCFSKAEIPEEQATLFDTPYTS